MAAKGNANSIQGILSQSQFSGTAKAANPAAQGGNEAVAETRRIAAASGSTTGSNPGSAPNRGLTAPGVVEAFLAATTAAASPSARSSVDPLGQGDRLPTGDLRKG